MCIRDRLRGGRIRLPFASVGATENAILAAVGCDGETVIENAAREPEIGDLGRFLRAAGAQIEQNGGEIHIQGGAPLHGATFTILPDRIETATYLCAAPAQASARPSCAASHRRRTPPPRTDTSPFRCGRAGW